jgi:hypothetical protein
VNLKDHHGEQPVRNIVRRFADAHPSAQCQSANEEEDEQQNWQPNECELLFHDALLIPGHQHAGLVSFQRINDVPSGRIPM